MFNKPDIQIKFYRKKAGLTLAELSTQTEIDICELAAMEKGKKSITMDQLVRIAAACKTSSDAIFGLSPHGDNKDLF